MCVPSLEPEDIPDPCPERVGDRQAIGKPPANPKGVVEPYVNRRGTKCHASIGSRETDLQAFAIFFCVLHRRESLIKKLIIFLAITCP